jgi:hypothetical protein
VRVGTGAVMCGATCERCGGPSFETFWTIPGVDVPSIAAWGLVGGMLESLKEGKLCRWSERDAGKRWALPRRGNLLLTSSPRPNFYCTIGAGSNLKPYLIGVL